MMKEVVAQTDNLRSQVAKNACTTLNVLCVELSKRDLDPCVDPVIECLLRKMADTNKFVAKEAEQALRQACVSCTDIKVFKCLN